MDAKDAQALLDGPSSGMVPAGAVGSSLNPFTTNEVSKTVSPDNLLAPTSPGQGLIPPKTALVSDESLTALEDYRQSNKQGDVPLDVESGIDPWTRSMLSFRRTQEDQLGYLEKKYGKGSVRLSSDGVPIVRVIDSQTKKPKDVRATEMGMSLSDFLDLSGQVPEIAGGILAARFGGGGGAAVKGVIPRLGNILAMSAGQEGAGAVKDVAVRGIDDRPVNFEEIATSRAKMLPLDIGAGVGMGAVGGMVKGGSKLVSPFSNPNDVTKQFRDAVKYFKDKGIELPMTPGEASGSSLLLRTEAMARQLPGSSSVMKDIVEQQNAAMARIQKTAMGLPLDATTASLPTDEQAGKKAIGALGEKVAPFEEEKATAKRELAETGTKEIENALASGAPVDVPKLGQQLRQSALDKRAAFQAKSAEDYGKVYEHPLANQYVLSADKLSTDAKGLLSKLPAPESITETPTGITDRYGNDILRDEAGSKIMRNFVPPNVLTKLNDLASLKGGKFRLGDLLKMRTDVANDIAQGEAIPGMNTHYLSEIKGMLDDTLKGELDKLPNDRALYDQAVAKVRAAPLEQKAAASKAVEDLKNKYGGMPPPANSGLKELWQTANDNYAKGVQPFQKTGISELYKEQGQGGYVGDTQAVERAMGSGKGQDTFSAYKEFFGEQSPEYQGLKRAVVDKLLGTSRNTENALIDPRSFLRNLGTLSANSPNTVKEVFGKNLQDLVNVGQTMTASDSADKFAASGYDRILNQHIPAKDLMTMIARGEPTSLKLMNLVATEKAAGVVYRNSILKQIAKGTLTGDTVKPSQFVRYFSTQAEPSEVHQVVSMLGDKPEVLREIRSKVAQDIFDRAYPTAQSIDNPALLSGEPRVLSQQGLQNALGDSTQRERYKAILGVDTYNDIQNLTKYLAPRGIGERAFSAAGGLSAGQQIAGLIQKGDLKYLNQAAKNWIMAQLYTHPTVRAWAANTALPNLNTAGFTRYLIASTPIVQAAYKEFGEKRAKEMMAEANASIDRSASENGAGKVDDMQKMEQYRRMLTPEK